MAREVEAVLQSDQASIYFQHMYGNQPDSWSDNLEGPERWRLITNYLTRMRYCTSSGQLELTAKTAPDKSGAINSASLLPGIAINSAWQRG